ncbi:MAG: sigma-70 family RNA polymerase sigma factor [Myxococcota bacterium]
MSEELRPKADAGPPGPELERAFGRSSRRLFGLCYRMTGSALDAEDLVQETFARALARPPADTSRDWEPWLVRVAVNLARDHLRRRRRRRYVGPWLPEPVEDSELFDPIDPPAQTSARYEWIESVSLAFLVALEALTPGQRAVLLLRDVFEYSGRETADVLGISEVAVRQTLRRARRAMREYDQRRAPVTPEVRERTREHLQRFLAGLATGDLDAIERLLAEGVVSLTDSAGEHFAARIPVHGRSRVARLYRNLPRSAGALPRVELREINGLPALVGEVASPRPGWPRRFVTSVALDPKGQVRLIATVTTPAKLARIAPPAAAKSLRARP